MRDLKSALICLAMFGLLCGCKKSGLLDYRNRYVGTYECNKKTEWLIFNGSDTPTVEVTNELIAVTIEKVRHNNGKIEITANNVHRIVEIDKNGNGSGSFSPYTGYTIELTKKEIKYVEDDKYGETTIVGTKR